MKFLLVFVSVLLIGVYSRSVSDDDSVRFIIVPLEPNDSEDLDDSAVADPSDPQIVNRTEELGNMGELPVEQYRVPAPIGRQKEQIWRSVGGDRPLLMFLNHLVIIRFT